MRIRADVSPADVPVDVRKLARALSRIEPDPKRRPRWLRKVAQDPGSLTLADLRVRLYQLFDHDADYSVLASTVPPESFDWLATKYKATDPEAFDVSGFRKFLRAAGIPTLKVSFPITVDIYF